MKAIAAACSLLILLAGCAAPGAPREREPSRPQGSGSVSPHDEMTVWRLQELAATVSQRVILRGPQGIYGAMDTQLLQRILNTGARLLEVAGKGPDPEWILIGSGAVNAFAFFNNSQPTIAISLGMVQLLADDQDAWAALLGHELAHLRLDHLRTMRDRRKTAEVTSSVVGVIASVIGLPFGSLVADATAELAGRAYSRDDERDADRIGLGYMREAGFAAQGAISLQQRLLSARASGPMPFLSTHPSGEERIENLRELMRKGN